MPAVEFGSSRGRVRAVADMTNSAGRPDLDPAAVFFGAKLRALMSEYQVRNITTGKPRKLTPLGLHRRIQDVFPDTDMSQSQLYRYVRGERAPRLDELAVIAGVLGVSPRMFVPATASATDRASRGS